MINKLEKEISNLEKLLGKKKDKLLALKNEEIFSNKNQLIAIVEMHDQFYQIADIQLVENNIKSIQKLEESYKNILYCHEFKFFKVKDLEEEYIYLQKMMNLQNIGEDAIQDWMTEHLLDAVNS